MKILFDQGTPSPLRKFLPKHSIVTVYEKGWNLLKNGDLIRLAEDEGFEVFVTLRVYGRATIFIILIIFFGLIETIDFDRWYWIFCTMYYVSNDVPSRSS